MAEPWERYQSAAPEESGPWAKYGGDAQPATPAPAAEKPGPVARFLDPLNPMHLVHALYKPSDDPNEDSMVTFGKNVTGIVKDLGLAQYGQGKAAIESWKKGNHTDALAQGLAAVTPVFGPMSQQAADKINSGDVAGGLGTLTSMAAPEILAKAGPPIVAGAKAAGGAVARGARAVADA